MADSLAAFQGGFVLRPYRRGKLWPRSGAGVEGEWVVLVDVIASNVYMKKTAVLLESLGVRLNVAKIIQERNRARECVAS